MSIIFLLPLSINFAAEWLSAYAKAQVGDVINSIGFSFKTSVGVLAIAKPGIHPRAIIIGSAESKTFEITSKLKSAIISASSSNMSPNSLSELTKLVSAFL